uniref:DNA repair protein RAD14 n=1 Tax=Clandestinovirus TaxID=2831644 RepID=A0A8F8PME3_9VIRU|nr:DNA repair protein RAD14 [Clandestinovirus]
MATSLLDLNDDCLLLLVSWLKPSVHQKLSMICSHFHVVLQEPEFWKVHLRQHGIKIEDDDEAKWTVILRIHNCCRICRREKGDITFERDDKEPDQICESCSDTNPLITKTRAKTEYKLTDLDLRTLSYIRKENPRYPRGSPMMLYLTSDVVQLSHIKHGGPEGLEMKIAKTESIKMKKKQNKDLKMKSRQMEIQTALDERGLNIPIDTLSCHDYINRGIGNVYDIVTEMHQTYFLDKFTNYRAMFMEAIRSSRGGEGIKELQTRAIEMAIKDWVAMHDGVIVNYNQLPLSLLPIAIKYTKKRQLDDEESIQEDKKKM